MVGMPNLSEMNLGHFAKFPVRVIVLRALAEEIDPWPFTYEGLYQKSMVPSSDGGSVESRSVILRRKMAGGLGMKVGFFLAVGVVAGILGYIAGLLMNMVLQVNWLTWPVAGIFFVTFGIIGWILGSPVELFEIPQQPQGAYQSNKDSDILWLYQTDLNEFSPILFKNKAMIAQIMSFVPDPSEGHFGFEYVDKFEEVKDEATGKMTKKLVARNIIPDSAKGYQFIDPKTSKPHIDAAGNSKFKVKRWKRILTPVPLFNGNWLFSGDPKEPILKFTPYAVAYKSSDLYQWLLLQAERQKFYMVNDWWAKNGATVMVVVVGVFLVILTALSLNYYSQITQAGIQAQGAFTGSINSLAASLNHLAANSAPATPPH